MRSNKISFFIVILGVIPLLSAACVFSSFAPAPTSSPWGDVSVDETPSAGADSFIDSEYTLVMYDDFSDKATDWLEQEDDTYSTNYFSPGFYQMSVRGEGHLLWSISPGGSPMQDVLVSTVAKNNGGSEDNMYGVLCRVTSADAFYGFVISTDGYYSILQSHDDGSVNNMLDETWYASSLFDGKSSVKIGAECVGDTLTLLVDDVPMASVTVPQAEIVAGNVGLLVGAMNDSGSDILFDEFSVYVK
jgi:hypothetical protein